MKNVFEIVCTRLSPLVVLFVHCKTRNMFSVDQISLPSSKGLSAVQFSATFHRAQSVEIGREVVI